MYEVYPSQIRTSRCIFLRCKSIVATVSNTSLCDLKHVTHSRLHKEADTRSCAYPAVSLRRNSVLRVNKEKLDNDIPEPKPEDAQGVLIDEKLLGFSQGFAAVCLNTTTGGSWRRREARIAIV